MKSRLITSISLVFLLSAGYADFSVAQGEWEDYKRAEEFLPQHIRKLVFKLQF